MKTVFRNWVVCLIAVLMAACVTKDDTLVDEATSPLDEYAGAYAVGPLLVTEIAVVDEYLAVVPPFWGSRPHLLSTEKDVFSFVIPNRRPDRTITFTRDASGAVAGLTLANVDRSHDGKLFRRLGEGDLTPAQIFMARHPQEAAELALADESLTTEDLYAFAFKHLTRHPTRMADLVLFLEAVREKYPDDPALEALYGYALVPVDRRDDARKVLGRALELNPEDPIAQEGARRLALTEPAPGVGYRAVLPFKLTSAFAPPTASEIADVHSMWLSRDLSARNVKTVHRFDLALDHTAYDGAIIRHDVSGVAHYGAVLTPKGVVGPLPVVIEARGVNPSFTPLDISEGTSFLHGLGEYQSGFIVMIPAMKGHTLILNGEEYVSEGDPSDAWDGATDTTLALLSAALEVTPQADPKRVAIYGHSRGGAVALLAGARDDRISLVLSVAGPVDHFAAMQPYIGWSWAELIADAMSDGKPATLDEEGGQKYDHFFDRVPSNGETLADVRRRMIASSALYFAKDLPETHAFFGAEDRSVPVANANALRDEFERLGVLGPDMTVTVYEGRGHDTDPYQAQQSTVRALTAWAEREA